MRNTYFIQREQVTSAVIGLMERIGSAPVDSYGGFDKHVYADFSLVRALYDYIAFHGETKESENSLTYNTRTKFHGAIDGTSIKVYGVAEQAHYIKTGADVLTASITMSRGRLPFRMCKELRRLEVGGAESTPHMLHIHDRAETKSGAHRRVSVPWLKQDQLVDVAGERQISGLVHFRDMVVDSGAALVAATGVRVIASEQSLDTIEHKPLGIQLALYT